MGIMLLFMRRLDVYLCGSVHVYLCGIVDVYLCGCTNLWVYPLTNHLWMCGCSRCSGRPIIYRHFPFNRLHIVKAFDPNITAQWNCSSSSSFSSSSLFPYLLWSSSGSTSHKKNLNISAQWKCSSSSLSSS